jgi:hypothetical protein
MPAKNKLFPSFFLLIYFLKVHLHHSSKTKVIKKSQSKSRFFLLSMLDDGRIRIQIRIRTNNRIRRVRQNQNLNTICNILDGGADPDPYAWVSIIVWEAGSGSAPKWLSSHNSFRDPELTFNFYADLNLTPHRLHIRINLVRSRIQICMYRFVP